MVDPAYPLSVVIATTVGWPRMRLSLDGVVPQVAAVGGQLIVADSSGRPVPNGHPARPHAGFRRRRGMTREDWFRLATSLLIPVWRDSRRHLR